MTSSRFHTDRGMAAHPHVRPDFVQLRHRASHERSRAIRALWQGWRQTLRTSHLSEG